MEEKIGRETLKELIKLQITIIDKYKELLDSDERTEAKEAVNEVVKAAINAVGPVLRLGQVAYEKAVDVHEQAVAQTRDLLVELLKEEVARADIHKRMREQAERGGREERAR
jgi:hypothetical protein